MHTLHLYSSLTTDRKDMVKILVRVLQNESRIHSFWMGYSERLTITEDNNISSVQYVLLFSLLEKNDYKNLASIKTDTVYKV